MKAKTFSVVAYGYYNQYPQGLSLRDAKRKLVDHAKNDERRCREKYGRACRHRITEFRIDITLTRDKGSALWSRLIIVED